MIKRVGLLRRVGLCCAGLLAVVALAASPALAEVTRAQWTVSAVSRPTVFAVGSGEDSYVVLVTNTGGAANEEEPEPGKRVPAPVTVVDELPGGLEVLPGVSAEDQLGVEDAKQGAVFSKDCGATGSGGVSCTYDGVVQPGDSLIVRIPVRVTGGAGSVRNVVRAFGGGASAPGVMETPTVIAESPAKAREETAFGVAVGGATTALSSVQAGAHADLTTTGAFDTVNALGATAGAV